MLPVEEYVGLDARLPGGKGEKGRTKSRYYSVRGNAGPSGLRPSCATLRLGMDEERGEEEMKRRRKERRKSMRDERSFQME
jgi:hypothetical protein